MVATAPLPTLAPIATDLTTLELAALLFVVIFSATGIGHLVGRRLRRRGGEISESLGVLQGALLGVVGLILAFGLSLALSRYEDRRAAIVVEANAIGTTYLRAQLLPEPIRSRSLDLLVDYTQSAVKLSEYTPGTGNEDAVVAEEQALQRELWSLAGEAVDRAPQGSAPRLYISTLNEMIDAQTARVAALNNEVPTAVLSLEVLGASIALALLAAYMALVGRGVQSVLLVALLVTFLLFVSRDLDRPSRGPIEVPNTTLTDLLESMEESPAAGPPRSPRS